MTAVPDAHHADTSSRPEPLLVVEDLCLGLATSARARSGRGTDDSGALVGPVSFQVGVGEAVGLVGESGSGKSLTALSLLSLLPPSIERRGGRLWWQPDGVDFAQLSERGLRPYRGGSVAYVFQDPSTALNPVLRVGHQVEEVLAIHRPELSKAARRERLQELFTEVELGNGGALLRRYPHELSGGQRQRVLLAAALAGDPELLIADEPTTALDVTIEQQILELLKRLQAARGLAMLWISHDLALVRGLCTRLLVMHEGALVEDADTETLFASPQHPHSQALVAAASQEAQAQIREQAEAMLTVDKLSVRYPGPRKVFGGAGEPIVAVKEVTFTLGAGRTLGVVGESGSGKSSLARAILRLESDFSGTVQLRPPGLGTSLAWSELKESALRPHRRHVGMVFQDPATALNPRQPVWRSVMEPVEIHRPTSQVELRQKAQRLLQRVGLDESFLNRRPSALSGGQAQRVGIARAIALDPCLVVCDEALSALDVTIQEQILELLRELQAEHGLAYLFISHDLDMVARLADDVLVMHQGRVVEAGATAAVLGNPQEPYTQKLLAASRAIHSTS